MNAAEGITGGDSDADKRLGGKVCWLRGTNSSRTATQQKTRIRFPLPLRVAHRPEADIHVVQLAWPSQQPVLYFLFLSPP
jgi:hypothetical protein